MNKFRQWRRNGSLWLIILYLLLSILVVSTSYYQIKQEEMNLLTRGLYDPTSFTFAFQGSSLSIDWRKLDTDKPYTVFNELDTKQKYADRAIYFNEKTFVPPMVSGRYFTATDFYTGKRIAVLGQEVGESVGKEDVFEKNGKEYFQLAGKTFEVIGRMGAFYPSEVDELALVNMDAIDNHPNLYVMNTEDNKMKHDQALSVNQNSIPIQVIDRTDHGAQRYLGTDFYQKGILIFIASILMITSLLFNQYWFNKRKNEIRILWQHGISLRKVYVRTTIQYLLLVSICYGLVSLGSSFLLIVWGKITIDSLRLHILQILIAYGGILLFSLLSIWVLKGNGLKPIDEKGTSRS
ncbi:ABC transporter permease [Paludifilum halophilum]|uniref:MacB-like periplasmic core domain-containing protein n=1 Tax=Paludifilum halophilum TaxID=1642702 RepID=A0A235B4X3_9BACL|nr:ABC transporter permease [Paludifilum halophilum]OYD07333.1 hypothetical protein CHM34_10480 [Paludifilum halophilum]